MTYLLNWIKAQNERHVTKIKNAIAHAGEIERYGHAADELGLRLSVCPDEYGHDCLVWLQGDLTNHEKTATDEAISGVPVWLINGLKALHLP